MNSSTLVESKLPCPHEIECGSSDGYHTYSDGHGYCFSCETYFPSSGSNIDTTYEYLPWRGVSSNTFTFYDVKTKIDKEGKPISIGYKYPNGSFKVRLLGKKEFYSVGEISKAGLFGRNKFSAGGHKYVCITEGELDACSLYQALGNVPVVSVQSASNARRDCSLDFAFLASFERIYLAFDNDPKGKQAERSVASLFDHAKVWIVKLTKYKDANEYLEAGEIDELKNLFWNAKRYLPENLVSSLQDFSDILKTPPQRGISYPFSSLTKMTYGIRKGESVLLTAPEGVGKTEVMNHIEAHLLKELSDDEGVGAIYLEQPNDRHLQALGGKILQKPTHLPENGGVSTLEVIEAVQNLVRSDNRLFIYTPFGSDDPDNILSTIRFLVSGYQCCYVMLDHINMVVASQAIEHERRQLEYLCTRLEMMVKELHFALIMVSHVNDEGQTRTSRWTSKIADVRIDLKRDVLNTDPIVRNTIEFVISKNRYSGLTGSAGKYLFDPYTRQYTEVEHAGHNDLQTPKSCDNNSRVHSSQDMVA